MARGRPRRINRSKGDVALGNGVSDDNLMTEESETEVFACAFFELSSVIFNNYFHYSYR